MIPARAIHLTVTLLAGCSLAALLAGCAGSPVGRDVRIEARREGGTKTYTSYRLRNANAASEADSLRYQEVSNFVRTALSGRGLHEAPNDASADLIIDVDFGAIAPGTREEVVRLPIYRTMRGLIGTSAVVAGIGSRGEDQVIRHRHRDPDRRVLVGHQEVIITNTHHERFLKLTAHASGTDADGHKPAEFWSVEVRTKGNDEDLREDLPLLAAAALAHVDRDTRGRMIVQISEDDPDIEFVKKGM